MVTARLQESGQSSGQAVSTTVVMAVCEEGPVFAARAWPGFGWGMSYHSTVGVLGMMAKDEARPRCAAGGRQ